MTALSLSARAQVVAAEPRAPIEAPYPADGSSIEVQVTTQLVVDPQGNVESAVVTSREPEAAPRSFDDAALAAVRAALFVPSTRDARPVRSRVEYVVVFRPPTAPTANPPPPVATGPRASPTAPGAPVSASGAGGPISTDEPDEDYVQMVEVRGQGWGSPRGLGDLRIKRELLDASPRQQTAEMLSAAPGFFVDHEDGEGLGNDVYLRGFDLDHGSGIEMRLGSIPINIPQHIQGQGYADANFIIPEVVRSIRVLEGPFDPRQGDAAVVGSAAFDLALPEGGVLLKSSFGSFGQGRIVGVASPSGVDQETFAAFALRSSDGFGENRASQSASVNTQYAVDLGKYDRLKVIATAYGARQRLAGVVRQDDVDAGRIGYYDSYPTGPGFLAGGQSSQVSRVIVGADLDHVTAAGARFEFAPWLMWTNFRNRQNYAGALESSQIDPALSGQGDLFELTNREAALGLTARVHSAALTMGPVQATAEPGVYLRAGSTDQTKSLLNPTTLQVWDRRIDAHLETLDVGGYADLDLRVFKKLHISGGPRVDLLLVSVQDRLAALVPPTATPSVLTGAAVRDVEGIAAGPRITVSYDLAPALTPVASYGEGFRSLDVDNLREGASPYSKIRSAEVGVRAHSAGDRYTATVALFETWVTNELVFEAASGGLETENASTRRGIVTSAIARPWSWLLASSALSVTDATFSTLVPGVGHYVPNIPPILFRLDAAAHARLGFFHGKPLTGKIGVGYTFLSGRHLTDSIIGPVTHALNAKAAVRYDFIEAGIDGYNLLGLKYADDAEYYVSNWSFQPGQHFASQAVHLTAAPPLTLLGTVALYF